MSYENITLEKGMYNVRGGITAALESIDPSENYKGTDLEGLDAFQRQLKRFDIRFMVAEGILTVKEVTRRTQEWKKVK